MNLIKWIKDGNDCCKCKYSWECITSNEDGTEYDGGCYISGDYDGYDPCRLIFPIKNIIGFFKKRKATYCFNHQYDNFMDFTEKRDNQIDKLEELISEHIIKDKQKQWHSDVLAVYQMYEEFAHPYIRKKLRQEWKELILKTFTALVDKFKPYFCK